MKKSKLLLTIPALVAPTTLVLSQCASTTDVNISLDKSFDYCATLTVSQDSNNNKICIIKLTDSYKTKWYIDDVLIKVGETTLEVEKDYSIESISTSEFKATIFKKTIDAYKGNYVLAPYIEKKELTGIIAELEDKTYYKYDYVTKENIKVFQTIEGLKDDEIEWNKEDFQVFDDEGELVLNFFDNGYQIKSGNTSTKLTIKYFKGENSFTTDVTISFVKKEATGIVAELERKSYHIGDTLTTSNITIYETYDEGKTKGDVIDWTNKVKVYEGSTELTDFATSGLKLTSLGSRTLTIKYNSFESSVTINVSKKEITVNCLIDSDECVALSSSSFIAYEGDKWGDVTSKPTPVAKSEDVDLNALEWKWVDPTTLVEISDDTLITDGMQAKLQISLPQYTDTKTYDCDTVEELFEDISYIPSICVSGESVAPIECDTNTEYSFTITAPTNRSIKYFWFLSWDRRSSRSLVNLYKNSIVSIFDGDGNPISYTFGSYSSGGHYLNLGTTITAGQKVTIKFRMLKTMNVIPAFQGW